MLWLAGAQIALWCFTLDVRLTAWRKRRPSLDHPDSICSVVQPLPSVGRESRF